MNPWGDRGGGGGLERGGRGLSRFALDDLRGLRLYPANGEFPSFVRPAQKAN